MDLEMIIVYRRIFSVWMFVLLYKVMDVCDCLNM